MHLSPRSCKGCPHSLFALSSLLVVVSALGSLAGLLWPLSSHIPPSPCWGDIIFELFIARWKPFSYPSPGSKWAPLRSRSHPQQPGCRRKGTPPLASSHLQRIPETGSPEPLLVAACSPKVSWRDEGGGFKEGEGEQRREGKPVELTQLSFSVQLHITSLELEAVAFCHPFWW